MPYNSRKHRRRSIRLKGYDYSREGAYFVTICTHNRKLLFRHIVDGEVVLNKYGHIVSECIEWLAKYLYLELDEWVIMPNHTHIIIFISGLDDSHRGGSRTAPTKPLGRLVGAFKTVSTKRINAARRTPGARVWQRNYYEHVIRG